MKLVRQEVGGVILSTSQQAHVNLQLVMFLGMHLESASKQWGNDFGIKFPGTRNINFNISFNTPFVVFAGCGRATDTSYESGALKLYNTYFEYVGITSSTSELNGCWWIALGK